MRLEITRKSDLAVRALCALGESARLKSSALAEAAGSTPAFMAQVMALLARQGWVSSDPGPTGGYRLAVSLRDLSMLAMIEAIEGPTDTGRCVLRGGPCSSQELCALHDAWLPARDALLQRLAITPVSAAGGCSTSG
jgi:Rrf2 family transcriptional regulator, iron-sulfur cluster assembly transcription factor